MTVTVRGIVIDYEGQDAMNAASDITAFALPSEPYELLHGPLGPFEVASVQRTKSGKLSVAFRREKA